MSDFRYAIIRAHEDSPVRFLSDDDLVELFEDVASGEDRRTWLAEVPDERDPSYWPDRHAVLIKFQVLKPPEAPATATV